MDHRAEGVVVHGELACLEAQHLVAARIPLHMAAAAVPLPQAVTHGAHRQAQALLAVAYGFLYGLVLRDVVHIAMPQQRAVFLLLRPGVAVQPAQLASRPVDAVFVLPDILAPHAVLHRGRQGGQILGVHALEQFMVGEPDDVGPCAMQLEEPRAGEGKLELAIRADAELEQPPGHLLRQPREAPLALQPHALAELALARQPQRQQYGQQQHRRAYAIAQQAALQRFLQRFEDGLLVQPCADDQRIALHPAPGIHAQHAIDRGLGLVGAALHGRREL
jgi:hypothetical protein